MASNCRVEYCVTSAYGACLRFVLILMCGFYLGNADDSMATEAPLILLAGKGAPDSTAKPSQIGDGGPAVLSQLINPFDAVADKQGNVFILDTSHQRIRKVDSTGRITSYAGLGRHGLFLGNGDAANAYFSDPVGLAVGPNGDLFVADTFNHRVYKIDQTRSLSLVAGTGDPGFSGDGQDAKLAQLMRPTGLFVTQEGEIIIADQGNQRIRRVSTIGTITTIAGNGNHGFGGDGGLATLATLADPTGVWMSALGELLIADRSNHRIRRVDSVGVIQTIAGDGNPGFGGDGGLAVDAHLNIPSRVIMDENGFTYICDRGNSRIRRVDPQGKIYTVLGSQAELNRPFGLSLSPKGELIVSDTGNHRVYKSEKPERWIALTMDRANMLANGSDTIALLGKVLGRSGEVALDFEIVEGNGNLSVVSAQTSGGLAGTRFSSMHPGIVVVEASTPGALPTSLAVEVKPIHSLEIEATSRTLVANGANSASVWVKTSGTTEDVKITLVEGVADLEHMQDRIKVKTTSAGQITLQAELPGAFSVQTDIWALEPKLWQLLDAQEDSEQDVRLLPGHSLRRSFHNSEDVDLLTVEVAKGYAIGLKVDRQIEARVENEHQEMLDGWAFSNALYADERDITYRLALSGTEGFYTIDATKRRTGHLELEIGRDFLVADGQETMDISARILDRFGKLDSGDDSTMVHLSAFQGGVLIKEHSDTVQQGMSKVSLETQYDGPIVLRLESPEFVVVDTLVEAKPALTVSQLEASSEGSATFVLGAGSGMKGITGIQARIGYDPEIFSFESFEPTGFMGDATPILVNAANGALEINMALLNGSATASSGTLGIIHFKLLDEIEGASDVVILQGQYGGPDGIKMFGIGKNTGRISFSRQNKDLLPVFQTAFGAKIGDSAFVSELDLNANGQVDFEDFLMWLARNR